jgi:selenocysteine-specific elongation factor
VFVLGTAGHIDHGKSVLIKALTGIDPDRLREEKERGMTIDLGFAWLSLPSGREIGIVDVPGHERFVKNMLAGVGGIDVAMLIVAANEGVMPQTREHLAILDLLRIRRGIVVITKKDLVDEDLLSLVKMEIEELISTTSLAASPIIAVSAMTGEGLPELKEAIDKLLDTIEPRQDRGRPRLPVDRIFTIAGSGTVVTGTLIDGSLQVGEEVEVVPSGLKSRLRGLQTHKSRINMASPGSRVAANLVGVNTFQIQRGDVVTHPGWLKASNLVTGKLALISYLKRPLRHGMTVSFHTGAAETPAKVRLLEANELAPGASAWAQFTLERPVAALKGDHFIIRSPDETLGGGIIVDMQAKRLRRFRPEVIQNLEARESGTADEILLALLEAKQSLDYAALVAQSTLPYEEARATIDSLLQQGQIIGIGSGESPLLFLSIAWGKLAEKVADMVGDYHRRYPVRSGMPKVEMQNRIGLGSYSPAALAKLINQKTLAEVSGYVRLPEFTVRLTAQQQAQIEAFLKALEQNPYSPPSGLIPPTDLLNLLIEGGKVVKVADNIVFAKAAYEEMVEKIIARIRENGKITLGEVRDMFHASRKYAQALLEYLDGEKITRRVGDDRVLY